MIITILHITMFVNQMLMFSIANTSQNRKMLEQREQQQTLKHTDSHVRDVKVVQAQMLLIPIMLL